MIFDRLSMVVEIVMNEIGRIDEEIVVVEEEEMHHGVEEEILNGVEEEMHHGGEEVEGEDTTVTDLFFMDVVMITMDVVEVDRLERDIERCNREKVVAIIILFLP